jgi:hypothetical protein
VTENSKLAKYGCDQGHENSCTEAKVLQIETNIIQIEVICPRVTGQWTQLADFSHLSSHDHSRSQQTTTPSSVAYVCKLCFHVVRYGEVVSLVMISIPIVL